MFLKLVCVTLLLHRALANDQLLTALEGVNGLNRMSLCMGTAGGPQTCPGALWRRRWVAARASCLAGRRLRPALVLRDSDGDTCDQFQDDTELWAARKIKSQHTHPEPHRDLVLLAVEPPYDYVDPLADTSSVHDLLAEFEPWMKDVYEVYQMYPKDHIVKTQAHEHSWLCTPIRMFLTTVLLPTTSFILFFLYVTFCTGTRDNISYKTLSNEKYDSHWGV